MELDLASRWCFATSKHRWEDYFVFFQLVLIAKVSEILIERTAADKIIYQKLLLAAKFGKNTTETSMLPAFSTTRRPR